MQKIKAFGMAFVAVLALSAIATSAASAEEFIASKAGKITGRALNTQKLHTSFTVECPEAATSGEAKEAELKFAKLHTTVNFGKCTALGSIAAKSSSVGFTLLFWNVSVLLNAMVVSVPSLGCQVEVPDEQTLGSHSEVEIENKAGKLITKTKLTKIAYQVTEAKSSLCGTVGEKGTNGTFEGNNEVELEGGTLEVK